MSFNSIFKYLRSNRAIEVLEPTDQGQISLKQLLLCTNERARRVLDYTNAVRLMALPLGFLELKEGRMVIVAVTADYSPLTVKEVEFAAGARLKPVIVSENVLRRAIFSAYKGREQDLIGCVDQIKEFDSEQLVEEESLSSPSDLNSPVVDFVTQLINHAVVRNASDLHITPEASGTRIRLRIDGLLFSHCEKICSLSTHIKLVNRVKVLSNLDLANHQTPQDGSFTIAVSGESIYCRVSIIPTIFGEQVVVRLLSKGFSRRLELESLGFPVELLSEVKQFLDGTEGTCLLAGPTGSGKTTTLYSCLKALQERELNIITIEDPVEIQLSGISQTEIRPDQGFNYTRALRAILRQDPDVIMLGEIRDPESAEIALQASLTGHLLLSTIHACSPIEALIRLQSLGLSPYVVASAVRIIICQKLIPQACPKCASESSLGTSTSGCEECSFTGFAGRRLSVDYLVLDANARNMIATQGIEAFAEQMVEKKGMALVG